MPKSCVKLVGWNSAGEEVCASAARISTTPGSAVEIFEQSQGNPKNAALISKVLSSGHKSVIEHMTFSIAFENVSAYVEQFFIECRLASFTVKSRRYVDYYDQGYFIPDDLPSDFRDAYIKYMSALYDGYMKLVNLGIPKEDARFLLPYSFCSNFYCTVNGRELAHVIREIRYGRGRNCLELQNIADALCQQLSVKAPWFLQECSGGFVSAWPAWQDSRMPLVKDAVRFYSQCDLGYAMLQSEPENPDALLIEARMTAGFDSPDFDGDCWLRDLMVSGRPRELEQLNYTFSIHHVSLAAITHLTRHRMQSLILPPVYAINFMEFVLPDSIAANPEAGELYKSVLTCAAEQVKEFAGQAALKQFMQYFAVAGNMMGAMTTMNARELMEFIRLRSCNRAQWEIRNIAVNMLRALRGSYFDLFKYYGPSCYLTGVCPEGKMSCGKLQEVKSRFGAHEI